MEYLIIARKVLAVDIPPLNLLLLNSHEKFGKIYELFACSVGCATII